jgi:betaine-aldehyde dehydrogenase
VPLYGSLVESERTLAVIDPSTEEVIAHVPEATPAHVDRAVASARAAFPHWSSLSGSERAVYLDAIAAAIRERKQPL